MDNRSIAEIMLCKKNTRIVKVGNKLIGGNSPVSIQSMTNTKTSDIDSTVSQIKSLESAGCDMVRCAVPDMQAAVSIGQIKKHISVPLVADIHFDYKLALEVINQGVDKLRINPGNIGESDKVKAIVKSALEHNIPIRIGVNAGSIDRKKYPVLDEISIVESGLEQVRILEQLGFYNIVLSFKASSVPLMVSSYRYASNVCDYPLHLGVTEAGLKWNGIIRSSIGIGSLLLDGIGDTVRVSLTSDPVEEVYAAKEILSALQMRKSEYTLISCPTCGRCKINLESLASDVDIYLKKNPPVHHITIAVMGCIVNGPGEAREADIGIAGGDGKAAIFKKGEFIRTVSGDDIIIEFIKEIENIDNKKG